MYYYTVRRKVEIFLCNELQLQIPGTSRYITPGVQVKLNRFDDRLWIVCHGWYAWGGNRKVCGWHLVEASNPEVVKPLQDTDLIDIYLIDRM